MASITRILSLTAAALAAAAGAEAASPTRYSFSVVAVIGSPAPGGGYHEADFEPAHINSHGDAVFASDLAQTPTNDTAALSGEGLYGRYRGSNRLIARSGDAIQGRGASRSYGAGTLSPAGMNDAGEVAFGFGVSGSPYGGVFRYDPRSDKVSPVLLPGDPAPGGMTFSGTDFHTDINNQGAIATVGIINTPYGHCSDTTAACLGRGVYKFDRSDRATEIAVPGDNAPPSKSLPGGRFDDAWDPNLNNRGDVVFGGHVAGETCILAATTGIGCNESLYLYRARTGQLLSVAHQDDPAPGRGGGVFKLAFNGRLNTGGDVSFIGTFQCSGDECTDVGGVFLRERNGNLRAVARAGDSLDGAVMKNTTAFQGSHAIDSQGRVAFAALLDRDLNGDGIDDTGVFLWSDGAVTAVVETGTRIPGLGTVVHVNNAYNYPPLGSALPNPGVDMNDYGQILTQITVTTGNKKALKNYVVVATPEPAEHDQAPAQHP